MPWQLSLVARHAPTCAALAVRGLNAFAGLATWMATAKGLSPAVKQAYLAPYDSWQNRIATLRFVQDIPVEPGDRAYPALAEVEASLPNYAGIPVMIGWGMRDFVFNEACLTEWRRRLPHAKLHTYDDAGHYVLEDAAPALVPLIGRFVRECAKAPAAAAPAPTASAKPEPAAAEPEPEPGTGTGSMTSPRNASTRSAGTPARREFRAGSPPHSGPKTPPGTRHAEFR